MLAAGPRATGMLLGAVADAILADPGRWHPVAGFGRMAAVAERLSYRDSRAAGVGYAVCCVALPTSAAALVARHAARRPAGMVLLTAATTWAVLGAASLRQVGTRMAANLRVQDEKAAHALLPALCSRDARSMGEAGLSRATVESVAENTSDAAVAPLLWGAVAGVPGLVAYRAANTLDAMVGYRSPRYRHFGTAAARLDDAANCLPARLTAALTVALSPLVGGSPRDTWRSWRRDASGHPSPNAGRCEAAFAGALGVRLGGTTVYDGVAETRGTLGTGRVPEPEDIARAVRLSRAVSAAATVLAAVLAALLTQHGSAGVAVTL